MHRVGICSGIYHCSLSWDTRRLSQPCANHVCACPFEASQLDAPALNYGRRRPGCVAPASAGTVGWDGSVIWAIKFKRGGATETTLISEPSVPDGQRHLQHRHLEDYYQGTQGYRRCSGYQTRQQNCRRDEYAERDHVQVYLTDAGPSYEVMLLRSLVLGLPDSIPRFPVDGEFPCEIMFQLVRSPA